jgi:ubiquinone/menaquinone biosynthesis C-methylase UbiE
VKDQSVASAAAVKRRVARSFDQVAGQYDDTEEIFSEPVAARLIQAAGIAPGERVLDVGCGTGTALLGAAAAARPGGQVVGIDLSQGMLTAALARAGDAGLGNVLFYLGDAENPPDPPCAEASFDTVIASLLVYLLPRPQQAARRWLRVLRPGGLLAFSWQVAEDPRWEPALAAADSYVPPGLPRFTQMLHHWPLTSVGELEAMLASAGYTSIATVTDNLPMRYPSPAAWWDSGWSRARRISWQHIPVGTRPAARAVVLDLLDGLRAPDGSITRAPRYGWTTARRPGPAR